MLEGYRIGKPQLILAIALVLVGVALLIVMPQLPALKAGSNQLSLGLLIGGITLYAGIILLGRGFRDEKYLSVVLLLPSIIAIGVFVYGFIAWSIRVSFTDADAFSMPPLADPWSNYVNLLTNDPRFFIDIRNTVVFTIGFLIGCLVIGLGLAILLDQRLKGETFFRAIFLFPMSISFIATGVVWGWLMNPAAGNRLTGLNLIFRNLHLDFLISQWHSSPQPWGMAYTVLPAVWQLAGFTMALYLGGLRSIPEEVREAARVDGATEFELYRYIIMPLLQPVTLSALIILGHMSLKIFDLIVALGKFDMRLDVPGIYMFRTLYDAHKFGVGAAIGVLMLMSVAVLVVPYLVYSMRTEAEL